MDTEAVKKRVRGLGFLLDCSASGADAAVNVLAEIGELREFGDGDRIIERGDVRGNNGFVLVDGAARVLKGAREPIRMDAPALMGELQQFSLSGSRSADVEAEGAAVVLRFEWPDFYAALEDAVKPLDFQSVKEAIRRSSWHYILDDDEDD